MYVKDDLWIVLDQIQGTGSHRIRLHWLCGEFPHMLHQENRRLDLHTPAGIFGVQIRDVHGQPLDADVVAGRLDPPRGWHSRYYGEKGAVPSLAVTTQCPLPATLVSLLSGEEVKISVDGPLWNVETPSAICRFSIADGKFSDISVVDGKSCT